MTQPTAFSSPRKIADIERLRGLAALLVVICHIAGTFYNLNIMSPLPGRVFGWLGQCGVALFFVISGFCIRLPLARARALDPAARLDVGRYLSRRARRILPPYWWAIALSITVGAVAPTGLLDGAHGLLNVGLHLAGLHTLWPPAFASINGVFWTIGLELQFYLVYLLLADRPASPRLGLMTLGLGLLFYGATAFVFAAPGAWRQVGQAFVLTTFWQWYIGAVLADAYVRHGAAFARLTRPKALTLRLGAGAACLALGLADPVILHIHVTYWALPFAAAGLVAASVAGAPSRDAPGPAERALSAAGRCSYSLYLLHPAAVALAALAATMGGWPPWIGAALALVGSAAAAAAGRRWMEQPFLAQRPQSEPDAIPAAAE
jgi:peptidoglycan/LPS O-acetylase OafA/YrhL